MGSLGNPGELYYMGNIGLNIADPEQRLHVLGNATITGNLGLNVITPAQRLHVLGNTALMGNVGIGTTSPAQALHVNGIGRFDLNGGSISISTPGGNPGFIVFDNVNGHRRDIWFQDIGIGLTASSSSSTPDREDGITIREGGNVGIQTYTPGNYPLFVNERSVYGLAISHSSTSNFWELYAISHGPLGLYTTAGQVGSFDATSGVYTPVSDRRVKTDIMPLKSTLVDVKKLKPSSYKMKANLQGRREIGIVAQDLKKHFPELVYENLDDKSGKTLYTVNYNGIIVVAVKAIQEQQEIIEVQAVTIDKLSERIEELERGYESMQLGMRRLRRE